MGVFGFSENVKEGVTGNRDLDQNQSRRQNWFDGFQKLGRCRDGKVDTEQSEHLVFV
jgi:hypothetical protein